MENEIELEGKFKWKDEKGNFTPLSVDDFEFEKIIGEGEYCEFYLATFKKTNEKYAIKKIFKELAEKAKMTRGFTVERELLSNIDHPFVLKLYSHFQDRFHFYYVLEYCEGGSVKDFQIKNGGKIQKEMARFYIAELFLALSYLRKKRIAHRDIRPANILICNGHIRLSGFDEAKPRKRSPEFLKFDSERMRDKVKLWGRNFEEIMLFHSPEILTDKPTSFMTDIWSMGITLFNLLSGKYPFNSPVPYVLFKKIKNRYIEWVIDGSISEDAKDFIDKILIIYPKKRLGSEKNGYRKIKNHPYFEKFNWRKVFNMGKQNVKVNWISYKGEIFPRYDHTSKGLKQCKMDQRERILFLKCCFGICDEIEVDEKLTDNVCLLSVILVDQKISFLRILTNM